MKFLKGPLALFLFSKRINNKNKTEMMDNRIMSFDEFVAKDQPAVDAMPAMQPEMPIAQEQPMEEPMMPQAEPAMTPNMEQPAVEPEAGLQLLEEPNA